jgi:hypothetical protein
MVESESIENTQVVVVMLVVCIITESCLRNSKYLKKPCPQGRRCPEWRVSSASNPAVSLVNSHPGYFGKKGQRHFHLQRNQYHCPTVNVDKLWSLVSEESRKASTEKKAAIIDVTKAVSFYLLINNRLLLGFLQGSRQRQPRFRCLHCPRQGVLQDRREAHQGCWRCLPTCRLNGPAPRLLCC